MQHTLIILPPSPCCCYCHVAAAPLNTVDNFNLQVKRGEFVTFLGPSGCGKTTTLRMIAGFEMPTSGQILLNGVQLSTQLTKDYQILVTSAPVMNQVIKELKLDMKASELASTISVDTPSDTRVLQEQL